MKAVVIRRSGKLIVAALGCAVLLIAAAAGGLLTNGYDGITTVLNDRLVRETPSTRPLRVLVPAGALYAPAFVANGGTGRREENPFGMVHGVSVELEVEEDFEICLQRLASDRADIVWAGADTLARVYPKVRSVHPVAFLLCGYSRGDHLVVARGTLASPDDYRRSKIACAADTSSHFMALYLLSLAGVRSSEADWVFTRTPAGAVRLFERGRADICAAPLHALAGAMDDERKITLISSTGEAARLVSGVFIARESTLLLRRDQVGGFIRGWFGGLAEMARDPEGTAALLARELAIDTGEARAEIARQSFAGYAENRAFFSIDESEWGGFSHLFDTACSLYYANAGAEPALSGFARNTDLLVSLEGELAKDRIYAQDKSPAAAQGIAALPGKHSFYFEENRSIPDFASRGRLARFARDAHVFEGRMIALYGGEDSGEDRWRNLPDQRVREVARLLVAEHRIPASRILTPNDRSLTAGAKGESTRRVDAFLVLPRRER